MPRRSSRLVGSWLRLMPVEVRSHTGWTLLACDSARAGQPDQWSWRRRVSGLVRMLAMNDSCGGAKFDEVGVVERNDEESRR
jgi:hypothetical protein